MCSSVPPAVEPWGGSTCCIRRKMGGRKPTENGWENHWKPIENGWKAAENERKWRPTQLRSIKKNWGKENYKPRLIPWDVLVSSGFRVHGRSLEMPWVEPRLHIQKVLIAPKCGNLVGHWVRVHASFRTPWMVSGWVFLAHDRNHPSRSEQPMRISCFFSFPWWSGKPTCLRSHSTQQIYTRI